MQTRRNNYLFAPMFSFSPEKVTLYTEVSVNKRGTDRFYNANELRSILAKEKGIEKPKKAIIKKFHNFEISDNAYRTLQKKISWLYYLSKSRYIKTHSGKEIYNFKMGFLTLTLPSKQVHSTAYITKNYFNQFITEIKKVTKMQNYVWRLEFQQNRNVHYHLVTDTYIDYHTAQKIWNRIINKDGYVDVYSKKFMGMNLSQYYSYITQQAVRYNKNIDNNDYYTFQNVAKRYAIQRKNKFSQPNSVDLKSVSNGKKISFYISKYFGKKSKNNAECNELDNEENSFSLRLWFCSRSLSKLDAIRHYIDEINWSPANLLEKGDAVKYVVHRYCTVIYFEFSKLINTTKKLFAILLKRYSLTQGYLPAT